MIWLGVEAIYHGRGSYRFRHPSYDAFRYRVADHDLARAIASEQSYRHEFGDGACVCFHLRIFDDRLDKDIWLQHSRTRPGDLLYGGIFREWLSGREAEWRATNG